MQVTRVPFTEFERILKEISNVVYDGNIGIKDYSIKNSDGTRYSVSLRAFDSRGAGTRTSASGRRGPYVSWEAFRDVLEAIFAEYPTARIATSLATYNGKDDFEAKYPGTAYKVVGSMFNPVSFGQLSN